MPSWVVSGDGTRIGYESQGDGPSMLLVHGEAFYLEALQLPQPAIDDLKRTEMWQIRLTAAPTITREIDEVNAYRVTAHSQRRGRCPAAASAGSPAQAR